MSQLLFQKRWMRIFLEKPRESYKVKQIALNWHVNNMHSRDVKCVLKQNYMRRHFCEKLMSSSACTRCGKMWNFVHSINNFCLIKPPLSLVTLRPNRALGSIQWTNTFGPKILKYIIKIIKHATLPNHLPYMKPFTSC